MLNDGNLQTNSGYFIRLVKTYLLENTHRVHMELSPSETLEQDLIAEEAKKVYAYQVSLNENQLNNIKMRTQHLKDVQDTVDPPEVVDTIPSLSLTEIDGTGVEYDIGVYENVYGTSITLTTNIADGNAGIVYVDIGLDISSLAYTNVQMLPFIISMLGESDTNNYPRVDLDSSIGMHTGGIDIDLVLSPILNARKSNLATNNTNMRSMLFFRGKCIAENAEKLLNLMKEIAENSVPVSQSTAIQIIERKISSLEAKLSSSGHSYAVSRIHARYNLEAFFSEQLYGYSQLQFLKNLLSKANSNWNFLEGRIGKVIQSFSDVSSSAAVINLTGDSYSVQSLDPVMETFIRSLGRGTALQDYGDAGYHPWMEKAANDVKSSSPRLDEGIPIPSQVSYVGKGGVFFSEGEKVSGANCVPLQYLRKGYLWDNVRAKNGAYGVSISLDRRDGTLHMVSYRDPNLSKTIEVYDNAGNYLSEQVEKMTITDQTIKTAIIGCIGDIDGSALPPRQVGWLAFRRFLMKSTKSSRQAWREEILSAKLADFEEFSNRLKIWALDSTIAAMAPETALSTRSWPEITAVVDTTETTDIMSTGDIEMEPESGSSNLSADEVDVDVSAGEESSGSNQSSAVVNENEDPALDVGVDGGED